jgi:hypothetical protein
MNNEMLMIYDSLGLLRGCVSSNMVPAASASLCETFWASIEHGVRRVATRRQVALHSVRVAYIYPIQWYSPDMTDCQGITELRQQC